MTTTGFALPLLGKSIIYLNIVLIEYLRQHDTITYYRYHVLSNYTYVVSENISQEVRLVFV